MFFDLDDIFSMTPATAVIAKQPQPTSSTILPAAEQAECVQLGVVIDPDSVQICRRDDLPRFPTDVDGFVDATADYDFTCARCDEHRFRDTPIHKGQSVRRDCLACNRTDGFPLWYGEPTK